MSPRSMTRFAAISSMLLALPLAGCTPVSQPPHPQPVVVPRIVSIDTAVGLLEKGDEEGARKDIQQLLSRDPTDAAARVLLESLDDDPVELLGPKSFAYTVQADETLLGLAERFLGNRLKFYQLARYNSIKVPAALAAGTVLRIPGEPPRPAAAPPRSTTTPRRPRRRAPEPQTTAPTPAPALAANPAEARRLRVLGLSALNQGKVDRAVTLLGRAAQLDPDNALIKRDLARAERIARTVKAQQ